LSFIGRAPEAISLIRGGDGNGPLAQTLNLFLQGIQTAAESFVLGLETFEFREAPFELGIACLEWLEVRNVRLELRDLDIALSELLVQLLDSSRVEEDQR
jgi:hypothetical protein